MPVFQRLINYNDLFHQLSVPPIILNDLVNSSEEDREKIKDLTTSVFTSDMVSLLPSCRCGTLKGEYSLGLKCDTCGSVVASNIESDIEPVIWFRKPNGASKLINPIVLIMLMEKFKKSGFSIIQWLMDKTYRPNVKQPQIITRIVEAGIQRGYNNFVENFPFIMDYLFSLKDFKKKKAKVDNLEGLIKSNYHLIFSDFIPLVNKSLLIVEKTNLAIYIDNITVKAIDVIQMLVSIDASFYDQNPIVKQNRTAKALCKLADFYISSFNLMSKKQGHFRRHLCGSRTNFSFRAVITSITGTHDYRAIEVPWCVGVTAFRPHLLNKLMNYGYDHNSAIGLLYGHVEKYHEILDKFLQELIDEAPDKKLRVLFQRNPSLMQGSAQRLYISKFKTNVKDHTIGLSILICRAFNADFDGDQMNCSIALDQKMSDMWYPLEPKFNIFQLTKPFEISKNISISKPNVSSISAWLAN